MYYHIPCFKQMEIDPVVLVSFHCTKGLASFCCFRYFGHTFNITWRFIKLVVILPIDRYFTVSRKTNVLQEYNVNCNAFWGFPR